MDQKSGARNFFDFLDILEPILYEVLEEAARLILSNCSDALKAAHEQETSRLPLACNMRSWSTAHAPSENNNIFFFNADDLVYVIINIERIVQDIVLVGLKNIFSVWLVYFVDFGIEIFHIFRR
jgi:hypothetical protein